MMSSPVSGRDSARAGRGGYLVVLVLVFGAVFFMIFTALMGYTISQKQVSTAKNEREQALQIAEAGLDYYKWFLAHNPDDTTNATTTPQPYVIPYDDPEGDAIGEYALVVDGNLACGVVTSIDITSTGSTYAAPDRTRTVYARYARPNIGEYSHIVNANVWAGDDREIYGPYHSNGFVRMDGINNSRVTSGQTEADCGLVDVCASSYPSGYGYSTVVDGVFGDGPNSDLWEWSVPQINFNSVTVDLSVMVEKAKNGGGDWYDASGEAGYYILFNDDGTYTLKRVRSNKAKGNAYGHARNFLNSAQTIGTYDIPDDCAVLYFEDELWIEGEVNGKVTVAAADVDTYGAMPSVTLVGNITYANDDSGLLLVAEDNIDIGLDVPDDMELSGIFMAQNGWFGRPYYTTGNCGSNANCFEIHSSMIEHQYKHTLTTNGTVVSNERVGTKWSCGGAYCNGFEFRYDYYDRGLAIDPPPLTPKTSDDYQFIEWREMD